MIEINKWEKEQNDLALLDEEFLSKLFEQEYHEKYARITSLTYDELPIARIEGKVTSGTINVDGNSNVRRTFNLTLSAHQVDINDYYWGIKTKVKLEIGLKNNLKDKENYTQYPKIIWFNQGTYVITTFNTNEATNGYTINISGKDKMCLLNGDLGGQLFASIDFGTEESIKKIFKKATLTDTSIDTIMAGNYYFIPDNINNLPDVVSSKDKTYEFQPINIDPPFYIKEGSNFRLINSNEINIGNLQKYRLYKQVTAPDEILIVQPESEPEPQEPDPQPSQDPEPETPTEPTPTPTGGDILTETPTPSKPEEEPFVVDDPQPTEPFRKPPKVSRVTGISPIIFTLPAEYDDTPSDEAEEIVNYTDTKIPSSGVERYIGETWRWRQGEVDYNYPPGGFMSKMAYEKSHPKNNNPLGGGN